MRKTTTQTAQSVALVTTVKKVKSGSLENTFSVYPLGSGFVEEETGPSADSSGETFTRTRTIDKPAIKLLNTGNLCLTATPVQPLVRDDYQYSYRETVTYKWAFVVTGSIAGVAIELSQQDLTRLAKFAAASVTAAEREGIEAY